MLDSTSIIQLDWRSKAWAYFELLKFRLSLLVAFSCAFGFSLASQAQMDWVTLASLTFGGFLLSGASVALNQVFERKFDKIMTRTMSRPIPTGRLSVTEATTFSIVCLMCSLVILWLSTNPLTVILSFISMVLYAFVYT